MAIRAYQAPSKLKGERLDNVLSRLDDSYSRSTWQKLIRLAHIKVDGQTQRDPAVKFNGGLIEFDPPELMAEAPAIPVIYKDDDVIVLDKPSGLLTHSKGQLNEEWTVADVVAPEVSGEDGNRPGIVHRLDRDTSGLIIVARNPEAKQFLQRQFAKRQVAKTYTALADGVINQDELSLDWPLARHPARPSTWQTSPNGKPAQTKLKVLKRLAKATLVELKPLSGRTHQLRVHLQKLGHPILGDRLYGQAQSAERLLLHASRLSLTLPSGERRDFSSPLPAEFDQAIKRYE